MLRRGVTIALVAAAAALGAPEVAGASISLGNVVARPTAAGDTCQSAPAPALDAPAGTHRDFCVSFELGGSSSVRRLELQLPPGVIGDPTATPTCSRAAFAAETCTPTSQVGDVTSTITAIFPGLGASGEIYNLTPTAAEPARLGILLDGGAAALSHVKLESPIRVRVGDAGLTSTTDDIPDTILGFIPLTIQGMSLRLWGIDAGIGVRHLARPFITLPTRCDADAVTLLAVTAHDDSTATASAAFRPTACDQVPFSPALETTPKSAPADTPGAASATLVLPGTDTGTGADARRQAYVRSVALHLPVGLDINPPLAAGLQPCTDDQFGFGVDAPPQCPANTEIGTVTFTTPLFSEPLTGKVYFGTPKPGQALRNFVSVEDPRLRLKLLGIGTVDPATGQVTATFPEAPQVPFTRFAFTYTGGPHGALTAPATCGTKTVVADMTPWSGTAAASPTDTFDVVDCPQPAFTPALGASLSSTAAGGDTGLTIHVARPDRQLRLQRMAVSLPPGLIGRLTAVPPCAVAAARANACDDGSRIGTAAIAVGTGLEPLSLPGRVFLTDGYDGSLAGLAIVVDATLPALDLGTVVTLARIALRPDGGIDVITDDLPQRIQGFATVYRSIDLTIDRPGFLRNATGCDARPLHGAFTAVGGAAATADAPYAATGCDALPFAPRLRAAVGAKNQDGPRGHPPLTVTIEQGAGETALRRTAVTLPAGIGVDLKNVGSLCGAEQLAAAACPAAARIGAVRAETPLLPGALTGNAYLTQAPQKGGLPGIALDLGLLRLQGSVAFSRGRVQTVFDAVPDVPLTRLVLALAGGPKAALTTTEDLCDGRNVVDAEFAGQSGATTRGRATATVAGCPALRATGELYGVARRTPTLRLKLTSRTPLRRVRVALPAGMEVGSRRVLRRDGRLVIGGRRVPGATFVWSPGAVVVTLARRAVLRTVRVTLPRGVLRLRRTVRAGAGVAFAVTATDRAGAMRKVTATLTAR
jgi:hypothetical protein